MEEAESDIVKLYDKIEAINTRDNLKVTEAAKGRRVNKEMIAAVVSALAAVVAAILAGT